MLSKDILNHKIKVQCGYCGETIGAFIEYLASGSDEFYYRGDKTCRNTPLLHRRTRACLD